MAAIGWRQNTCKRDCGHGSDVADVPSIATWLLVALNKADLREPPPEQIARFAQEKLPYSTMSATTGDGLDAFREKLWEIAPRKRLSRQSSFAT